MAEADIFVLPGVERRDIGGEAPSERVLNYALEANLHDVIVIGKNPDGSQYFAAADGNADAVTGKLFNAAVWLSTHEVQHT